jgi:hypothetical protein
VVAHGFAEWDAGPQIGVVSPTLPLALSAQVFPCRALAQLAARAALGGPRETLLGVIQAVRLVDGAVGTYPLPEPARRARAASARSWLAALAMPATARQPIGRTIDATAGNDLGALAEAWADVVRAVSPACDLASRHELRRVSLRLPGTP